ncbi:MAG: AAA family ATPase, partial [Pirellulaceae bacterium]|nr:AAA family ATPase [Pirellulaceae bacterium]
MTRIDSNPDDATTFVRASHAIDLNLPAAASLDMNSARQAIRRELRDSAKWKRLRIRQVKQASESAQGTIYELQVGHAVEFDWTWEGAVAFRPLLLTEFESSQATRFTNGSLDPAIDDSILWSGEVLEVDEATGRIFVIVTAPEHPPTRGSFYVRPFEFLSFLDAVYNEPAFEPMRKLLPPRLAASLGGIHPEVLTSDHAEPSDHSEPVGLPELQTWWRKSWSILWGPPGTGKTYTTGQQVAAVLADPTERILILSSTNRATDAVATAIGHSIKHQPVSNHGDALQSLSAVRRIGKGASYRRFDQAGLTDLLQGTETEFLSRIENLAHDLARSADSVKKAVIRQQIKATRGQMQDAAKRNFLDARVRVVIGTAFMATSFLNRQEVREDLELERAPFTTVIIDEAGLMSRVIIAALSLLASRRVILVGDSKQLAPISRISRILEPGQGNWLARSGLGHLDKIHEHPTGVHVLSRQYRMHPDVCQVVSAFQYDGQLSTAPEVVQRPSPLPRLFQNQPRAMWYILDEETHDLPTIRADRGPGNRSWVRPITLDILRRLFSDSSLAKTKGLFISPFNAQAKLVHTFFASADIKSWMSSTVHSQQGSEADIVIFDTVNAGSYGWAYDDWKRLINVGLSRAREAILLLASRAEMEEPYLRPLLQYMAPRVLRQQGSQLHWQPVSAQTRFRLPQVRESSAEYVVGHQLSQRKQLEPVLSHEQQRLCGLKLDGKPRLVRGVAGSGKTVVLAHWLMQTIQRMAREADVRIWAVFANRSLQTLIGDSIESAWRQATGGKSFPWHRVELHHVREILSVMLPEAGLSIDDYQFDYDEAAKAYLSRRSHQDITPRCHAMFVDEAQDMGAHTLKLLAAIVWQSETTDENSRAINIFYDNAQNIYGRPTPKWSDLGLDMRGRSSVMKESFRSTRPITELALNVLYRLQPPHSNPDHKELVARGLIEREPQSAIEWWRVRFNQV